MRGRAILLSLALLSRAVAAQQPAGFPTPETHFGFRLGADGHLAAADDIEKYFQAVAAASDRVRLVDIGATTEGHHTIAAIVSSPDNIRNLDQIRAANQQLADPRTLTEADARRLAATEKAVIAIGASIHATEIGGSQAATELLHALASATDEATTDQLKNLVVIIIPMLNPDGHRLVVDWYNKYKGTVVEGGPMPWLDHKYAGHDINRDAFMMNLAESRNLARFFYREWHPQVFLSMHEMDAAGPRFFTPPVADPIDPNVDAMVWRQAALLGSAMALELERDHHAGVVSGSPFDYFSPGYEDTAPLGHNTIGLLTEAAGVKIAMPVTAPRSDGAARDVPRISAPTPWPGGQWTLRDIIDYELSAVRGLLRAAAAYREDLVWNFYTMGARAIDAGRKSDAFAFVIPPGQQDALATVKLEQLLIDGGIEIDRSSELFTASGVSYPAGTDVIFLAQPYRAYVKTLLERQTYPATHSTADQPYDVTGWTLPAQMGVEVRAIDRAFDPPVMSRLDTPAVAPPAVAIWGDRKPAYYLVDARGNAGAVAANRLMAANMSVSWLDAPADVNGFHYSAGSLLVASSNTAPQQLQAIARSFGLRIDGVRGKLPPSHPATRARVALYKPWGNNADEGWTRWILEQYEFPYSNISPADVRRGTLRDRFDVIIVPSATPELLTRGLSTDEVPAAYAGGLAEQGLQALDAFVRAGGTLVCLDQSTGLAITLFTLPIKDVAREAGARLVAPGTILRLDVDQTDPLSYGLPKQTQGFFASSSAYDVSSPDVKIAARYASKDLLVSGLLEGGETIEGRSAVVSASIGSGRVVLLGFPVQHRAQSLATFRLLFNAIFSAR